MAFRAKYRGVVLKKNSKITNAHGAVTFMGIVSQSRINVKKSDGNIVSVPSSDYDIYITEG